MFTFKLTRLVITGFLTLAILCGGMNVATTGGLGPVPAYADDGDDLLLSIVPVLAAQSRLRLGLQVDAPGTGEALTAGSWYTIAWQGAPSTETVDIQLSTDGGATYPITVATRVTNDLQSYIWGPVPFFDPAKLSSSCKIKIRDTAHPQTIFAESAGLFSLQAAADAMTVGDLDDINYSLEFDPEGIEQDSDGDGMYDNLEIYLGTDPLNWDSDRDGLDDYWEVFGDVSDVPVPDKDGDSKIAPLDNDDDNDGLNDGRALDDDGDGIPNYLETYGFVYIPTAPQRYQPWDGDIGDTYYKTNPRQASTDQDQYGDSMEVSKINMDLTVKSPGDNPMIAAFPNFVVKLIDYDVELNSTITETNGSVHTDSSDWDQTITESTSVTNEWHWEVGTEVNASLSDFGGSASFSYGQSQSTTSTRGTARSQGGSMSDATEWSQASSTNPSEAAMIKMNLQVRNVGTCVAQAVSITLNLQIGGKNIATLTHPTPPGTIDRLIVDQSIN